MNILVVNQPLGNRGDEAAHKAFIRTLCSKIENAHVIVLFVDYQYTSISHIDVGLNQVKYISILSTKPYRMLVSWYIRHTNSKWMFYVFKTFRELWAYYQWSDVVVCAPGGICMGGFQNWSHLYFLAIGMLVKKPIAYYGRSIGPFPTETRRNRRFRKLSLELLNYFSYISLRDGMSEDIASKLGVNYVSTIDTAFLETPDADIPDKVKQAIDNKPYVIFVPNALIWHYYYRNYSEELVLRFFSLLSGIIIHNYPNHKILMLPQLISPSSNPTAEILFFNQIKRIVGSENMIVLSDKYSSDIQQAIISHSKMVVGARYHSIVFALNNNVPFVALSYEHKIVGLLEELGLDSYCCDITHALDSDEEMKNAISKIEDIIKKKPIDIQTKGIAQIKAQKGFESYVLFLRSIAR